MNHLRFDIGDVILREGTYGETMYEITSGTVGIYAAYGLPKQRMLATLGQGDSFGEMGLVEFWARSATAVAMEDGTCVDEVNLDEFMAYIRTRPEKTLQIMRQLSARIRETDAKYVEACRTIHDAIEAERAGKTRGGSLRSKLFGMIQHVRGRAS